MCSMRDKGIVDVKPLAALVLVLLVGARTVRGQVQLGAELEGRTFMVGEAVVANIAIRNFSPEPLVFDDENHNAELRLEVRQHRSGIPPEAGRFAIRRSKVLMPGETIRDIVEVSSIYDFWEAGTYQIRLLLTHASQTYASKAFVFDMVNGIEITSARYPVSGYETLWIDYSLRYMGRDLREEAFLIIKPSGSTDLIGSFSLGPVLRVTHPVIEMRPNGNVVVVHQSGRNRFTRSVFDVFPQGAEFVGQSHFLPDGTPLSTGR